MYASLITWVVQSKACTAFYNSSRKGNCCKFHVCSVLIYKVKSMFSTSSEHEQGKLMISTKETAHTLQAQTWNQLDYHAIPNTFVNLHQQWRGFACENRITFPYQIWLHLKMKSDIVTYKFFSKLWSTGDKDWNETGPIQSKNYAREYVKTQ